MAYNKYYSRINWKNRPSTATALGATNLNHMDTALNEVDNRIVALDQNKLEKSTANTMVKSWDLNLDTGIITVVLLNGTTKTYDTLLEKIAVNFDFDGKDLLIQLDDGTTKKVDLSSLIDTYSFVNSATVGFTQNGKQITAAVTLGSITEAHLDTTLMEDIRNHAIAAQEAAKDARLYSQDSKRYAVGGVIEGDAEDNAKWYMEQAEIARQGAEDAKNGAEAIVGVGIANDELAGIVKTSEDITADAAGKMSIKTDFVEEDDFAGIAAGTPMKSILGRLSRWFIEIGNKLDKKNVVNNLTTTTAGNALDARMGKELLDKYTKLNSDLAWQEVTNEFTDELGDAIEFAVYANPGARLIWIMCNYSASGKTIAADQNLIRIPDKYRYIKYAYGMTGMYMNPYEIKLANGYVTNGSAVVSGLARFRFALFYPY